MPAPTMTVSGQRSDPYRTFKFQLLIGKDAVAGLRKMSPLKKTTEAIGWRTAGDPSHERRLPGATRYEPITLEQGLTLDPVFEQWANQVNNLQGDAAISLRNFRKELILNLMNLEGVPVISYKIHRAWVSEYQALPELDAGTTNRVGIQTLKIEHEGWERDTSLTAPDES